MPGINPNMDHLFRHQYGRMVSVLTRKFGLSNLQSIEDAVQDSFITALRSWPNRYPDDPEAWLYRTASNRLLEILRKQAAEKKRIPKVLPEMDWKVPEEPLLETEVEDSQLRMIFTACNPVLDPRDQIAFALKTISGFSEKEISSALLLKRETVKKRLQRARTGIEKDKIKFEIPSGHLLPDRLAAVHEVIYLIFNEGFHSIKKELLIREDLCGEALRLCRMVLSQKSIVTSDTYALFALLCFHSARLRSKTNEEHEIISLSHQDRSTWYKPLIELGNSAMNRAVENEHYSRYHYEAAIAFEHLRAASYEETDWGRIVMWYERLQKLYPSPLNDLNLAVSYLQLNNFNAAKTILDNLQHTKLEQRQYLYYGLLAEFFLKKEMPKAALKNIELAIAAVSNQAEKQYLTKKREKIVSKLSGLN